MKRTFQLRLTLSTLSTLALGLVLAACAGKSTESATPPTESSPVIASAEGVSVTQAEFTAYLEYSRITPKDDAQRRRLLEQYTQRLAVASQIRALWPAGQADAISNDAASHALIQAYVKSKADSAQSVEALRAIYDQDPQRFEQRSYELVAQVGDATRPMGWVDDAVLPPPVREALRTLKPGDKTPPLADASGQQTIYQLQSEPRVIRRSFEQVRAELAYGQKLEQEQNALLELQRKVHVTVDP